MMRAGSMFLACFMSCLAMLMVAAAADEAVESVESVSPPPGVVADIDRLLLLQDATAKGDRSAVQEQKDLLVSIADELRRLPENPVPQLTYPLIAYVMSGGDPRLAAQLSQAAGINPREQRLLKASGEFMQGERDAAADVLERVDPLQLPARVAGRIALAQALLARDAAQQASYAVAVSAMPGTLVEESALRRSALAYAEARDGAAFWRRLERYGRRFPSSVYAAGFWADVMQAVVTWSAKPPGPDLRRLDTVLAARPLAERQRLYLILARRAVAASNTTLTDFAARRLQRLAESGSAEEQLGLFYVALYEIVSAEGDGALQRLRSLRRDLLGSQEQALLDAGLALGAMIERPEPLAPAVRGEADIEPTAQELRGSTLLAASSGLLSELD